MRKLFSWRTIGAIVLLVLLNTAAWAQVENPDGIAEPELVVVPGTIQSVLGCDGDWEPACEVTALAAQGDSIYSATFTLPAGEYEYKVALNGAWDENYGANGVLGGDNIALTLEEDTDVTFTYDHGRGLIFDSVNGEPEMDAPPADEEPAEEPDETAAIDYFDTSGTNPDGYDVPLQVVIPGTLQIPAGCDGEWNTTCPQTELTADDDDGLIWTGTFALPAGEYEYKVALNGTWDQNYGLDGEAGGPNIPLSVAEDSDVIFVYNHALGQVFDSINFPDLTLPGGGEETDIVIPDMVNVPGTIQPELGDCGEWDPACEATQLEYLEEYNVWTRTFDNIAAGSYEYKVAIDGAWTENYGAVADQDGPNIALNVPEDTPITFWYDHETNWIMDDIRHFVVTAPGSYQDELGCAEDWDPACMITWLQDVDGDGIYTYSTRDIPAGDYEAKVAINRSWDENYGAEGEPDGANIAFNVPSANTPVTFTYDSNLKVMVVTAGGSAISGANMRTLGAYWVLEDTLLWSVEPQDALDYRLIYSTAGEINVSLFGMSGVEDALTLTAGGDIPAEVLGKFPHLEGLYAYTISDDDLARVPDVLKTQFAIAAYDSADNVRELSGVQIPGVLDDLYTYDGPLGPVFDAEGVPTITVWAPTAQDVNLLLYADSGPRTDPERLDMDYDAASGTWSITGDESWEGQFYTFEVTVYAPTVLEIVTNEVTDPYTLSLSMNSTRSQIVDLSDPDLMPEGWLDYEKPALDAPEDITIYELHIRDFSAFDESVPEELRGTYLAFTLEDSAGMQHLQSLVDAGLTHLHLLPSFDIATINENRDRWFEPDPEELAEFAPDSDEQQAALEPIRDLDGFNWGYDPYHFNVPEGSYSTEPDGAQRILEYRQMVKALNELGLRVAQDVVYNHTNSSGQAARSVLDKVVPGYYHRLNSRGLVETSTCCQNTATEHNMMRRLMIDSIILNATHYKIDAFRFDLMGHHMLEDMLQVREALDSLTLEEHGVDGESIYIYGEGWNFGEVANDARGVNATQINLYGTGIGTFNDRLRDAVRGGSPVDGERYFQQGLTNGLYVSATDLHETNDSLETLLTFSDLARIGLAGNLRDYSLVAASGETVTGADLLYNDSPLAGYTADPQENIIYVSKHDNETLYDNNVLKAPRDVELDTLVRMQNLGLSYVMYAQGVPFFHAGSDMLRSKSLDRNSYNSGDWFNRLDFTYEMNNFGVGLPPEQDNGNRYEVMQPLLAEEKYQADSDAIMQNADVFRDMLNVRYSTPLFRLETAEDVMNRVAFHNTGPEQVPGLIVMSITDTGDGIEDIDPDHDAVFVVFNATPDEVTFAPDGGVLAGLPVMLHGELADGSDSVTASASFDDEAGAFTVPGYTTAVYVQPQS